MPFHDECCFMMELADLEFDKCNAPAFAGVYFSTGDNVTNMISLCQYHLIYQESIWVYHKEKENGKDESI